LIIFIFTHLLVLINIIYLSLRLFL